MNIAVVVNAFSVHHNSMTSFRLTAKQQRHLQEQIHQTRDARELRRALSLLAIGSGVSIPEAARRYGVSWSSIYRWIEDFRTQAKWGRLRLKPDSGGRPSVWTEELDEMIQALLSHSPDHLGYPVVSWTAELLRRHIERWLGDSFSDDTLRRHLHRLGYAWKRPRYVLDPDPKRSQKMRKISENIDKLDERSVILFEDETDLLLFPPLRSNWARKGEAARVAITGWNAKRVVFGAINARTGSGVYLAREHQRAQDFQFFLRTLQWHYRGWHIVLILDEGKCHVARSTRILARVLGIELFWLPHRAPELNPIESLWGKAKDAVCANRQYDDIDDQTDQFITYLQDLSSAEVLKKTGLTLNSFWLWKNSQRFCGPT